MHDAPAQPPRRNPSRSLPYFSWLLVVLVALLGIRSCLRRPTTQHRRRVAAFSQALRLIQQRHAYELDEQTLFEAAMRGMFAPLDDPHSGYMSPIEGQHVDDTTKGEFGGVGIVVNPHDRGAIVVEVQADGPAQAAGVRPGDLIVGVDGQDCAEMPFMQLISSIRGKIGTTVSLALQRANGGEQDIVEIERRLILMESVTWKTIDPGIGYVQIKTFDGHCLDNVKEALAELQAGDPLNGLLLDVRGNPGGLLEEAVEVSDLFLSSGVIVRLQSRIAKESPTFRATGGTAVPADLPIAILADGMSASAAEVLSGALQSGGRATVIGVRTFGKGAVNRDYLLPNEGRIRLTVAHYTVGEDGRRIHGQGIEPDIEVGKLPPPPVNEGREKRREWLALYRKAQQEQLDRAVEWLKSKAQ